MRRGGEAHGTRGNHAALRQALANCPALCGLIPILRAIWTRLMPCAFKLATFSLRLREASRNRA